MEEILQYINWNYLFIFVAVFALIGALIGLIRGIYKTSTSYIVKAILILVLVLVTPSITNLVSGIDVSSLVSEINLNGNTIQVTTIDETLIRVIESLDMFEASESVSVYETAVSMAHSIISIIVFLVGLLLIILLLSPLVSLIVYLLTYCIFVSKERRKHKKHRFVSAGVGFVCSAVVFSMFLFPFSSVVAAGSRIASTIKDHQTEDLTDSDVQAIIDLLASYEDSAFYSALSFYTDDPYSSIDRSFMSKVTEVTIDGERTSFYDQISVLTALITGIDVDFSIDKDSNVVINLNSLLSPDTISGILEPLSQWQTLMYVIPAIANMGINQVNLDVNLDFSTIDFSATLDDVNEIYYQLYNAGLIDDFVIPSLTQNSQIKEFEIDYSKKENYKAAIKTVLNNEIIRDNLPVILANIAKTNNETFPYLSSIEDVYKNLNFTEVFDNLIDFLFDGMRLLNITVLSQDVMDTFVDDLLSLIEDPAQIDNVKALLCGGEIDFSLGSLEKSNENNKTTTEGLLNNALFSSNIIDFPEFLVSLTSSIDSLNQFVTEDDLVYIGEEIEKGNLAQSISPIIDAIPNAMKLFDKFDSEGSSINLGDKETIDIVSSLLDDFNESTILKNILPSVLEQIVSSAFENENTSIFGLTVSNFNFNPKDDEGNSILISEAKKLLNILGDISDLQKVFKDYPSGMDAIKHIDPNSIRNILNTAIENEIINPELVIDGVNSVKNHNIEVLVRGLFSEESLSDIGLRLPDDLSSIDWENEVNVLAESIEVVQKYIDFFTADTVEISSLTSSMIDEILSTISKSQLLSGSISSILNQKVAPELSKLGISINFNVVTDWGEEARYLGAVIDNINALGIENFENVDWINQDVDTINALLTACASSSIFAVNKDNSGNYTDKFGDLIYSILSQTGIDEMIGISLDRDSFSIVANSITGEKKPDFAWVEATSSSEVSIDPENPDSIKYTRVVTTSGEIVSLCDIFREIKELNLLDSDILENLTGSQLAELLKTVVNSKCVKMYLPYVLDYALHKVNDINLGTEGDPNLILKITELNPYALLKLSDAELDSEIDSIGNLYDLVNDDRLVTISEGGLENIPPEEVDSMCEFLDQLLVTASSLNISNTARVGSSYSFYDQLVAKLLHFVTIDEQITNLSADQAYNGILPFVEQIDNWEGQDGEISKLVNMFRIVLENGINYANFSSPADIQPEAVGLLFNQINESELLHPAVPRMFNQMLQTMNINNLLTIDGTQYRHYNTEVYVHYSSDAVSFWANEIDQLVKMFSELKNYVGEDGDLSFDNVQIGGDEGLKSYAILGPISKMHIFDNLRGYIVYSLIDQSSGVENFDTYLRDLAVEDIDSNMSNFGPAERINNLLFQYGKTGEYLQTQCEILDQFIQEISVLSNVDLDDMTSFGETVYNLGMSSFKLTYENGVLNVERSYLCQEIFSKVLSDNFVDMVTESEEKINFFKTFFYADKPFGDDYLYFNISELQAIRALASLVALEDLADMTDTDEMISYFSDIISAAFIELGPDVSSISAPQLSDNPSQEELEKAYLYQVYTDNSLTKYVTLNDSSVRLLNSRIAIEMIDYYAGKVNVITYNSNPMTLAQLIEYYNLINYDDPIDFENESFESSTTKLIDLYTKIVKGQFIPPSIA